MTQSPPSSAPGLAEQPTDLYCPQCEYNLRGIDSPRCPECGIGIDYETLRKVCTLTPQSLGKVLVPNAKNAWQVHWGLCALAWFHPRKLAERMPYRHVSLEAHYFNLINKLSSILTIVVMSAIIDPDSDSNAWLAIGFAGLILFCSYACEMSIALVLRGLVKPRGRPDAPAYHFWRGIQHVMSCHLIVSTVFGIVGYLYTPVLFDWLERMDMQGAHCDWIGIATYFLFYGLPVLYWWMVINRTIIVRGAGYCSLAIVAIPVTIFFVTFSTYLMTLFAILAWSGWLL